MPSIGSRDKVYQWHSRGLAGAPDVSGLISSAANRYGVPPSIALAVATKESQLNQGALGSKGEVGVFQLMPATAADLSVNPFDLTQNVDGGVRYLSQLYRQFGDWFTALEAYNGGPGNVARGTVSNAAQSYASSILGSTVLLPAAPELVELGDPAGDGAGFELSGPAMLGLGLAGLALVWAVASD